MCDIAEGSGVNERWSTLKRLHEVGTQRVLEQQCHGPGGPQIARADGLLGTARGSAQHDLAKALLQIGRAGGQRDDRHDLTGGDDHPAFFAHRTVARAHADDGRPECTVVHVDRARPGDSLHVEPERIAVKHVIVQKRRQQRVGARDGVKIAREVEIDVVHWQDLRVPAAGSATLHAEHRSEAGLTHTQDGVSSESSQGLGEPHTDRALAFACRCWTDGGDEHELSLRRPSGKFEGQLGFVAPVLIDVVSSQTQVGGNVSDRSHFRRLGDFDIGGHSSLVERRHCGRIREIGWKGERTAGAGQSRMVAALPRDASGVQLVACVLLPISPVRWPS